MLDEASRSDVALFCYEGEGTVPLGSLLSDLKQEIGEIAVIIGSEGGFSQEEVKRAEDKGLLKAGLGKRILRTETAALFALSCVVYRFELS